MSFQQPRAQNQIDQTFSENGKGSQINCTF